MSRSGTSLVRAILLVALAAGLAGMPAAAAQPTPEQQSAIKAACQSDYRAQCASVPPGGAAALECLQKNVASLSPSCQSTVNAVGGTPAATAVPADSAAATAAPAPASTTAPQPTEAQLGAIRSACPKDYGTYCVGVPTGGPAALQCLQKNAASLSPSCKGAVEAVGGTGAATATGTTTTVATSPPATAKPPTQAQQSAIKSACQSDYRRHCASGSAALQCLQKNAASLSPSCKKAVAAVGGPTVTTAATTTAAAAAGGTTTAAAQKVVVLTPRQEMAIMREACGADYQAHCAGVRIVGGAARQCLAAHAAALSPSCRSELARP